MNAIYKFVMSMLAKRGGKTGIATIQSGKGLNVELSVEQIHKTLTNMGVDVSKITSPKEVEKFLNIQQSWLKQQTKGPTILGHPVIDASSSEGQGITRDLFNMLDRQSGKNVIKTDFGGGITDDVSEIIIKIKTMKPMDSMKEANKVLKGEGRYKSLSKADRKKIVDDESVTDHIFERNIEPDPEDFAHGGRTGSGLNYLLGEDDQNSRVPYSKGSGKRESWTDKITRWGGGPSMIAGDLGFEGLHQIYNLLGMGGLYAEGGRTGFGIGGISKARRLFLKMMGGAAAGTAAAKSGLLSIFKGGATKSVIKDLTSVPIKAGADGMPLWFKPLVNKVIKEGDDVTKKFATQDRQIVHQSTLPDSKTPVTVTQDITTGNVSVDIGMTKHGFADGHLGQPVRLEYRASEVIEPTIKKGKVTSKGTKTKEEFNVEEAEFTGGHPENIKFEETISEKFGKHGSNFDEVEKFATGTVKKKTAKESLKAERAHWVPEGDMASGGRVPLAEGSTPSAEQLQQYYEEIEKQKERERIQRQLYEQRFGGPGPVLEAASGGIAGMLGE